MLNKEAFTKLIISPDQWYLPIYALKCMGLDSKKKKKKKKNKRMVPGGMSKLGSSPRRGEIIGTS